MNFFTGRRVHVQEEAFCQVSGIILGIMLACITLGFSSVLDQYGGRSETVKSFL